MSTRWNRRCALCTKATKEWPRLVHRQCFSKKLVWCTSLTYTGCGWTSRSRNKLREARCPYATACFWPFLPMAYRCSTWVPLQIQTLMPPTLMALYMTHFMGTLSCIVINLKYSNHFKTIRGNKTIFLGVRRLPISAYALQDMCYNNNSIQLMFFNRKAYRRRSLVYSCGTPSSSCVLTWV